MLVALGSYTILTNKQKKLLPAACIPLFFGIQQLAEGNLWASFDDGLRVRLESFANLDANTLSAAAFLMFAFLIWPIWIPLAALLPEKDFIRKKVLQTTLIIGVIVGGMAVLSMIGNTVTIKTYDHSIQYFLSKPLLLPLNIFLLFYGISVVAPSFIASTKGFSLFAITSLTTMLISYYFYFNAFTSTWCFFSAWLSILIVRIIRAGNEEASKELKHE